MSAITQLTDRFGREGVQVVAIVDLQWGDVGKGKLVDCIATWADVIARGTGGANAGHTIILGNKAHVFHLVPSGILWDREGKENVIGRGVAVEPRTLATEILELEAAGHAYNGLRISHNAHLVLPFDIALDRLKEAGRGSGTIGTTGRGIGPVYESRVARIGLSVNDLLNKDVFAKRIERNLEARIGLFLQFDPELIAQVLKSDALDNGAFYAGPEKVFDVDAVVERYLFHARKFHDLVVDTDVLMQKAAGHKRVLLEGAQGVLLSVAYGTYPYVTSSDCSLAGLAAGVGLRTEHVDYTLGVVKAPYMTRVGKGPFPTECGRRVSARWCNEPGTTKDVERATYPQASLNSPDSFEQGVAIRQAGNEYGATTGRPRRVGWLDLPLLRYALPYASETLALTKVDVLNDCEHIKVCARYRYEGPDYRVGRKLLTRGALLDTAIVDPFVLECSVPEYIQFPGWRCDIRAAHSKSDIPKELREIIRTIEHSANVRVDVLSTGADRDDLIVL